MNLTKFSNLLMLALVLAIPAAIGCKKKPTTITPLPSGTTGRSPTDVGPGAPTTSGTSGTSEEVIKTGIPAGKGHEGWDRNPDMFKADTVHFDYDSSAIRTGEKPKVAAVADYLKSNSSAAVEIQGHCDERGTEEYNRALGVRRALALREEMARLGVDPGRVDTISYGKDRPVDTGHDEASHAKNRRGEFVLLTPPK